MLSTINIVPKAPTLPRGASAPFSWSFFNWRNFHLVANFHTQSVVSPSTPFRRHGPVQSETSALRNRPEWPPRVSKSWSLKKPGSSVVFQPPRRSPRPVLAGTRRCIINDYIYSLFSGAHTINRVQVGQTFSPLRVEPFSCEEWLGRVLFFGGWGLPLVTRRVA